MYHDPPYTVIAHDGSRSYRAPLFRGVIEGLVMYTMNGESNQTRRIQQTHTVDCIRYMSRASVAPKSYLHFPVDELRRFEFVSSNLIIDTSAGVTAVSIGQELREQGHVEISGSFMQHVRSVTRYRLVRGRRGVVRRDGTVNVETRAHFVPAMC